MLPDYCFNCMLHELSHSKPFSLLVCRMNNNNVGFAAADVPPACASCNSDCARC
jgi:hypothetical protein